MYNMEICSPMYIYPPFTDHTCGNTRSLSLYGGNSLYFNTKTWFDPVLYRDPSDRYLFFHLLLV